MAKPLEALNAANDFIEFWGNKEPKCPHCGTDYSIHTNETWGLYSEGEHNVKCPVCDLDFKVISNVTYTFNTDEQDDPDDD